jgi:hypothetical protein
MLPPIICELRNEPLLSHHRVHARVISATCQKTLPQRGERIDQADVRGEELDAMRDIRRDSIAVAGEEMDGRFAAEEKKDFALDHIADLFMWMLMRRVGLCLRAIVEVDDHQHQVIGVHNPALGAWTEEGNRQIGKFECTHKMILTKQDFLYFVGSPVC